MSSFTERLTGWYRANKRELPWRATKNAYTVWLSEIILQQTRVEQGLPYWERFVETYPTISDLAAASEESVLRLWQGLGYYSRARNLHATAKHVANEMGGSFPDSYDEILKLKGIGPYTAAAIASICFEEPKPVVDGNVFRFISRFFGVKTDITSSKARKEFETLLEEHIPNQNPGDFNQALMEFGARVCAPSPNCADCLFSQECYAYENAQQKSLPVKSKKTKVRDRFLNYIVFKSDNTFLLKAREEKDVWQGLYDFHLIEGKMAEADVLSQVSPLLQEKAVVEHVSGEMLHILSHQKIKARFYDIHLDGDAIKTVIQKTNLRAFSREELLNLPKPKLIVNYLTEREII